MQCAAFYFTGSHVGRRTHVYIPGGQYYGSPGSSCESGSVSERNCFHQSPELNPIERLWDVLESTSQRRLTLTLSMQDLGQILMKINAVMLS